MSFLAENGLTPTEPQVGAGAATGAVRLRRCRTAAPPSPRAGLLCLPSPQSSYFVLADTQNFVVPSSGLAPGRRDYDFCRQVGRGSPGGHSSLPPAQPLQHTAAPGIGG